jgi:hypothetical protein
MSVLLAGFGGTGSSGAIRNSLSRQTFERVFAGSSWSRLWLKLTGRYHHLYDLTQVAATRSIKSRRYEGLRSIPLQQIQGSEGRAQEFTRDFRPLREHTQERWQRIDAAMARGRSLPPVDLIKIGDIYFVRDGHHRISVAKARGGVEIEALVVVWEV